MKLKVLLLTGLLLASTSFAWNDLPADVRAAIISAPEPDYPATLWRRGVGGAGRFRLTIDPKTGHVSEVKVVRSTGHVILNELAAKAFLQWRFKPGTSGTLEIDYSFEVSGGVREVR